MLTTTNNSIIAALRRAQAYPHRVVEPVQLLETHISWVLLTGEYAYKIKKPVNFGFLDFSTLAKRRFYCQEEIRLNRRLAKDWYLEAIAITGEPETPEIGGNGPIIEYAVKMRQFPSSLTLRDLADRQQITSGFIDQISAIVADFHQTIDRADAGSGYGDIAGIKHWFDENFQHIKPLLDDPAQLEQLLAIETWGRDTWVNKSAVMTQRKRQGFIRECHGDLHLGNMSLIDGRVILFDCIEFNPFLRWIDVISEAAFLVMDLLHLKLHRLAFRFLNQYLQHTGDYEGMVLFRYYLVYRALVRAKVALLRKAQQPDAAACAQIRAEYTAFVNLADGFSKPESPMLIITHGFSGSGKSTYASQLAETIGALQIRADIERKRLFGHTALAATGSEVDQGLYSQSASENTYRHMAESAKVILASGFSVIIDAAFLKYGQRQMFQHLAEQSGVEFKIIEFKASEQCLYKRIEERRNDPSEATIEVLQHQLKSAEPLADAEKKSLISVDTEENDCLDKLLTCFDRQD